MTVECARKNAADGKVDSKTASKMEGKNAQEGYARFVAAIQDGRIVPGSDMTQAELCAILGMSLTPLREVLVLLEEYGLAETRPRSGIRVVYPDVDFYRRNFQLRRMIETFCLQTGLYNLSPRWIAEQRDTHGQSLENLQDESRFAAEKDKVRQLDLNFHRDLVASIANETVSRLHQRAYVSLRICIQVHRKPDYRQKLIDTLKEHQRLIDAIAARDVGLAVATLEQHFQASTARTYS